MNYIYFFIIKFKNKTSYDPKHNKIYDKFNYLIFFLCKSKYSLAGVLSKVVHLFFTT